MENECCMLCGVIGFEGFFENDWEYNVLVNYGKFEYE